MWELQEFVGGGGWVTITDGCGLETGTRKPQDTERVSTFTITHRTFRKQSAFPSSDDCFSTSQTDSEFVQLENVQPNVAFL